MELTQIIGLTKSFAEKLKSVGINQVEDLVNLTKEDMEIISKKTGIPLALIDVWQEHADLMRIEGITPLLAHILNEIGIDSVRELSHRNARNLLEKAIQYLKENPKLEMKSIKIEEITKWINEAKKLTDEADKNKEKPKKKSSPAKDEKPLPNKSLENYIIEFPMFDDSKYGSYGAEYWNNKYIKAPIIYTGRALRGKYSKELIDVDVKTFIKKNDEILKFIIKQYNLRKNTPNETALAIQQFVVSYMKYIYDEESSECPEFWQFPFESIQSGIGDCEDGAILICSLMINAGIPSWRCKVAAGGVIANPFAPSSGNEELGGHAFALYLADRPESPRKLEWIILDWCYLEDPDIQCEKKPLAKDGGHYGAYKQIWFTFNDEYSWAQNSIELGTTRVKQLKEKVKAVESKQKEFKSIEKIIENVFKQMNIQIEEKKEFIKKKKKYKIF